MEDEFKFESIEESEDQSESEFEKLDKYSSDWRQYEKLQTFNKQVGFMAYVSRTTKHYTTEQLVYDQKNCPELKIAYGFLSEDPEYFENLSNTDYQMDRATQFYFMNCEIWNGVMTFTHEGQQKVVLPLKFRQSMLYEAHSSATSGGHFGYKRSLYKIRKSFWFLMHRDMKSFIEQCKNVNFIQRRNTEFH